MLTLNRLYTIVTYNLVKNTGWILVLNNGKQDAIIGNYAGSQSLKVKILKNICSTDICIDAKRHNGLLWDYQYKVKKYK